MICIVGPLTFVSIAHWWLCSFIHVFFTPSFLFRIDSISMYSNSLSFSERLNLAKSFWCRKMLRFYCCMKKAWYKILYKVWPWVCLKCAQKNVSRWYIVASNGFTWLVGFWILIVFFILFYNCQNFAISKYCFTSNYIRKAIKY